MKGKTSKTGVLALALVVALAAVASWFGFGAVERYFMVRVADQSQATLRLAVAGLRGALQRYEPLPALIAGKADIKLMLTNPGNTDLVDEVNRQLKTIASEVGASDVYVLDRTGLTLAASNFDTDISFVNRNFSYRPYFSAARDGGLGRYFALGTTSLVRGYYFAAPVRFGSSIPGVVTVKINVDDFEAAWRGGESEIIVTDEHGTIFMSSRKDWHFRSLGPLPPETLVAIKVSRQYPIEKLGPLSISSRTLGSDDRGLLSITSQNGREEFVSRRMDMPEAGWTVHILTPTAGATTQTYVVFLTAGLLVLLAGTLAAYLLQRRSRLVERIAAQREARAQLERRVDERTADLNEANEKLVLEVEERTAAERQLRKTQADLVQAAKLAALGQMSAALSHEFNQPLAAVKSYADNAGAYLDRDRRDDARENITRISDLADQMAAISKHLRNFARKPQEKPGAVPVATVVNDAIEIMAGKLKSRTATVSVDIPTEELWVTAGQIRLQQVLVNLISNALDAMSGATTAPLVEIAAHQSGDRVEIRIRDHGPGLSKDVLDQIFDPFFTTKGTSKGLGLGLSISYNIVKDFGGNLSAVNHEDGGAVFIIDLPAADRLAGAAAE